MVVVSGGGGGDCGGGLRWWLAVVMVVTVGGRGGINGANAPAHVKMRKPSRQTYTEGMHMRTCGRLYVCA